MAASHGADAVAVGDDILMGASAPAPGTPEAIGLLAHELTHVGLTRSPEFVPPVAQAFIEERRASVAGDEQSAAIAPATAPIPTNTAPQDGEALARLVEAQLTAAAHQGFTAAPTAPTAPGSPGAAPIMDGGAESGQWGALPAPWDPLPEWLAPASHAQPVALPGAPLVLPDPLLDAPSSSQPVVPSAPLEPVATSFDGMPGDAAEVAGASSTLASAPRSESNVVPGSFGEARGQSGSAGGSSSSSGFASGGSGVIHAAPSGRALPSVGASEPASGGDGPADPGNGDTPAEDNRVEPNLDALARQVYAVVQRRLAAEQRRMGYGG